MDPLSVSASVVGLLAAGAKITDTLFTLADSVRDARQLAEGLTREMADVSAALGSLQSYIYGQSQVAAERGGLIPLEHVLTTLTGCVMTYSDLEKIIGDMNLGPAMGAFDRLKWVKQEPKIAVIEKRLQNHKSSLTLMLTILQCQSMHDAQDSTRRLYTLVEEVLQSNRDLASRIKGLEREGVVATETDRASTLYSSRTREISESVERPTPSSQHSFDQALQTSRVYNRATSRYSMTSTTSTALHTTALSMLSNLSLSQVSDISFFALPLYSEDLSNHSYYTFGEEGASSKIVPIISAEISQSGHTGFPLKQDLPRKPVGLLGRFALRRNGLKIGDPENLVHLSHLEHDPKTGKYRGFPREWEVTASRVLSWEPEDDNLDDPRPLSQQTTARTTNDF